MASKTDNFRFRGRTLLLLLAMLGLPAASGRAQEEAVDYRLLMRELVGSLAVRARAHDPDFIVVAQNGVELLTVDGNPASAGSAAYLQILDGVGQEELFYGYPRFNRPTTPQDSRYLQRFLETARDEGLAVLVIDYCRSHALIDDARRRTGALGFLGFASPNR